jgi:hypothetical protein
MTDELLQKVKVTNEDKIRVLDVSLVDVSDIIKGHYTYKITFLEDNEVKEDQMIGRDVSDALYRFQQINFMNFNCKFNLSPFKNKDAKK